VFPAWRALTVQCAWINRKTLKLFAATAGATEISRDKRNWQFPQELRRNALRREVRGPAARLTSDDQPFPALFDVCDRFHLDIAIAWSMKSCSFFVLFSEVVFDKHL
jgi:hypothetical protein